MKNRVFLMFCTTIAFSTTVPILVAQDKEATATAVRTPAASVSKMGPLTVTVEMLGGQKVTGTLTEITDLPFRGAVGDVKVMLSEVAGVKMASADDPSTTIIFKNGDSVTGATDLKVVSVDTEWGSAKINGSSITSLLLLPDLKWNASIGFNGGLNGKRWSLVDGKNTASSQPGQMVNGQFVPNTASQPGTRTTTGQPTSRVVSPN